jgi:hypothetical protein
MIMLYLINGFILSLETRMSFRMYNHKRDRQSFVFRFAFFLLSFPFLYRIAANRRHCQLAEEGSTKREKGN